VAAQIYPFEQNPAAEDCYARWREPLRTSSGQRQFECSASRPVRLPKTTVIEGVLAFEKNNIWEHERAFILTVGRYRSPALRVGNLRPRSPHNLSVLMK
jgi:hypothetical protein